MELELGDRSPAHRRRPLARWIGLACGLLAAIIAPFVLLEAQATGWSVQALEGLRDRPLASGVLVGALLVGDVLLPIPSSIVGAFAGSIFGWTAGAILVWSAMTAASLVAYALGRGVGGPLTRWLVGDAERQRAKRLFDTGGALALALTRGVPVLSEAGAISAGAAGMNLGRFLAATMVGNAAVAGAYAGVGARGGQPWLFLTTFMFLAGVPLLAWMAWRRLRDSRMRRGSQP